MQDDRIEKIYCSVCGAEMSSTSRCCIKCGALNYEHPANAGMKKYDSSQNGNGMDKPYIIGNGSFNNSRVVSLDERRAKIVYSEKIGKKRVCELVNILLLVAGIALIFLINYLESGNDILKVLGNPLFEIEILYLTISFLESYSLQLLYMKCNEAWWKAWVPFYNIYILYKIAMGRGLYMFLSLIPIVGTMIPFYKLGKAFNTSPILVMFFPFIFIPVLAFNESACYYGVRYVDHNLTLGDNTLEKEFKSNKRVKTVIIILILLSVGGLIYTSRDYLQKAYLKINSKPFISNSKLIMDEVEKGSMCSDINAVTSYIEFSDAGSYFSNSDIKNTYQGYVKIENYGGEKKYFICLNDDNYGSGEVSMDEIDKLSVQKGLVCEVPDNSIICDK